MHRPRTHVPKRRLVPLVGLIAVTVLGVGVVTAAAVPEGGRARPTEWTLDDVRPDGRDGRPAAAAPVARTDVASPTPHADRDAAQQASLARAEAARVARAIEEAQRAAALAAAAKAAAEHELAVSLQASSGVDWDGIAQCETGGNWSMQGPRYSGGVGFYNGTWTGFGGGEFAPNAGQATRDQQIIVAERVRARHGLSGWGCKAYG